MAWLLDTNVLSELRRPRPEPKVVAFVDGRPLESLYISVVTAAEIRFGIELVAEPNRRATDIALYDGLSATSQHAWPRLDADLGALVGRFAPLFPAGFYYKMFFRSPALWRRVWEPLLRRMGEEAQKRVMSSLWPAVLERYTALYQELSGVTLVPEYEHVGRAINQRAIDLAGLAQERESLPLARPA